MQGLWGLGALSTLGCALVGRLCVSRFYLVADGITVSVSYELSRRAAAELWNLLFE